VAELDADPDWAELSEHQVLERAAGLEDLTRLVTATRIAAAGVIERRGMAARFGASPTAALLRDVLRIRPGEARSLVRAARTVLLEPQLTGHVSPPRLPELADAMLDGSINTDHIWVMEGTIRSLPPRVPPEVRATVERTGSSRPN
jgi:hypothetical protein